MKQFLLPCALLIFGSALAQTPLLEEDFESYDNGSYIGESSSVWSTWSELPAVMKMVLLLMNLQTQELSH